MHLDVEHSDIILELSALSRHVLGLRRPVALTMLAVGAVAGALGALRMAMPGAHAALWITGLEVVVLVGVIHLLGTSVSRQLAARQTTPLGLSASDGGDPDSRDAAPREPRTAETERTFLRNILDVNPNFVFAKDRNGRFTMVNKAVADAYGTTVERLVGKTDADFNANAEEVAAFRRDDLAVMDSRKVRFIPEERVTDASGTVRWLQTVKCPIVGPDGRADQVLGVSTDISERKRLESELLHAQKMEAVGRMAGGIAHDFNNLLTVITSYSSLVLDQVRQLQPRDANGDPPSEIQQLGADLRADVTEIKKAADRAATLTGQLLAFSRKQVTQPRVLDLGAIVIELDTMLRRLIREDVALEIVPSRETVFVHADRGQLEQIIVNLAVNARDAMPTGGRLRIKIETATAAQERAPRPDPGPAGGYAILVVSDTGTGMDAETLAHVFEPFFTTKGPGKGTGLGLSTAYGIVKQAGGELTVTSASGEGTRVRIVLPRVAPPDIESEEPALKSTDTTYGNETILLVEDDSALRALAARVLREAGYTVMVAADGQTALAACERHPGRIDLLATDVVMPGMSCQALVGQMSARIPGIKVLYMSGYTDNEIVRRGLADPTTIFVQKPFTPEFLARKVREALATNGVR